MARWAKATVFGGIHFVLQIFVYAFSFVLGPELTTREALGISFYDVATVITFPVVYLAEKYQWSGLGMSAFVLNSVVWGGTFHLILVAKGQLFTTKH